MASCDRPICSTRVSALLMIQSNIVLLLVTKAIRSMVICRQQLGKTLIIQIEMVNICNVYPVNEF